LAARTQHPQAIVMDVRMKDRSGIEAVEELKRDKATQDFPVVMLSGCFAARQQAFKNGCPLFLAKTLSWTRSADRRRGSHRKLFSKPK